MLVQNPRRQRLHLYFHRNLCWAICKIPAGGLDPFVDDNI